MADVWLTFGISAGTPSIPNNTTPVTVTVYANWRYGYYNKNNKSGTLTIDGTPYSFAAPFNTGVASSGRCTLYSKSTNIKHADNGKKTLNVSASYATGVVGTVSASDSRVLPDIPRVSDLSVNKTSVPADGSTTVTATATKKSSSFTDILTFTLGSRSMSITSGSAFTIPLAWNDQISGTSRTGTITLTTKSGSTVIGTKTARVTVTVPASVVPTISGANISEAVSAVTSAFGNRYIQNLSQLNVSVDASGAYGSTIRSYSISLDGVNYIQQAFTSNVIKTAGTLEVKVKVTDSRGRTAENTFPVDIVEYIKPTITSMVYMHCDSDGTPNSSGTSTKVTIAGKVYPVDGQNTKALKLKYKSTAEEVYTERVITLSDWTFSVDVMINNTDPTVTYEYIAELTDKINTANPETFRVTTGIVVLSRLAGGGGITLFGEAEEEGFIIKGDNPMKFISDVALAKTRQHLSFIGINPIASVAEDTVANWVALRTGVAYFNRNVLVGQPTQYGWVQNITYGNGVFQIMYQYNKNVGVWVRAGNADGWYDTGWVKHLDETNGIQMKKLWQNASPTSNFAAQTINLDLSKYSHVKVVYRPYREYAYEKDETIPVGKTMVMDLVMSNSGYVAGSTVFVAFRTAQITTSSIKFAGGLCYTGARNDVCLPTEIYGVKGVQ